MGPSRVWRGHPCGPGRPNQEKSQVFPLNPGVSRNVHILQGKLRLDPGGSRDLLGFQFWWLLSIGRLIAQRKPILDPNLACCSQADLGKGDAKRVRGARKTEAGGRPARQRAASCPRPRADPACVSTRPIRPKFCFAFLYVPRTLFKLRVCQKAEEKTKHAEFVWGK